MIYLLDLITPINLHEEEEKFLKSTSYNPIFRYKWQDDPGVKQALSTSVHIPKALRQAVLQEDRLAVWEACKKMFTVEFDADTVSLAHAITTATFNDIPVPGIDKVAEAFELGIRFFNLDYSIVLVKKPGFFFRPNHLKKKIYISAYAQLQFFSIDGVVKHELTHVLRKVNSLHNAIHGSKNYLSTEEGLASYMQDHYGALGERSLFQHAAEYSASVIGCKGSLRDIYNFFRSIGFGEHLAWQRAARHKFGFTDTSQPGDTMKPASYFYYEQKVKLLSDDERWKLFNGKISLQELPLQKEYTGIIPLEKIKQFYLLSSFGLS